MEQIEILMVEDNHFEAELVIRNFKKNNLANKLLHIDDGAEALDFIFSKGKYLNNNSQAPKLILLDLNLPKVGGLEILRQIKSDPATKMIPVIILTSSKEDSDVIKSYDLGVNSYIVKPVEFDSLSKAVAELGFYWLLLNQGPFHTS